MADASFTISADTRAAEKSLQDFANRASQSLSQVQSSTQLIGGAIKGMAALFAASKLSDLFSTAISEAAEAEKALTELNFALAAAGDYSKEASDDLVDFGAQIQATTQFSQDAVIAQAAFAKSLGLTNNQTKDTIKAATQLATVTGMSLDAAVFQLSQTYEGQTGRLTKMLPALRGMTEEQLRAGAAIDYVNKRFGGFAEAMAGTYMGAMAQMRNQLNDVFENLGNLIVQNPLVIKAIQAASGMFQQMAGYLEENKTGLINLVSQGIGHFIVGASSIVKILGVWIQLTAQLTQVLLSVNRYLNGLVDAFLDLSLVQRVIGTVVALVTKLAGSLAMVISLALKLPKVFGLSTPAIEDVSLLLNQVALDLDGFSKSTTESGGKNITTMFKNGKNAILDMADAGVEMQRKVGAGLSDIGSKGIGFGMSITQSAAAGQIAATKLGKDIENAAKEAAKATEELRKNFEALRKQLETAGMSNAAIVDKKFYDDARLLSKAFEAKMFDDSADYAAELNKLKLRYNKERLEAETKDAAEAAKAQEEFIKQNFKYVGEGLSAASNILQGRQGATKLISMGAGKGADALVPGSGQAVEAITQLLAQGPDQVKAMVKEFMQAIPDILTAIGESIPIVILTFLEELPGTLDRIIEETIPAVIIAIAENADDIAIALAKAMPRVAIALAMALPNILAGVLRNMFSDAAQNFVQGILDGAGRFVEELINSIGNSAGDILGTSGKGGGIGGFVGEVGDFLGFAEGGLIPAGFPNDNFPARLTSGEYVIDKDTTRQLQKFLNQAPNGGQAMAQNVTIKVGERTLAQTMLNMKKRGHRF